MKSLEIFPDDKRRKPGILFDFKPNFKYENKNVRPILGRTSKIKLNVSVI